jgi:hypothetical protein
MLCMREFLASDSQRAWKEMDHHFTLNERIARRIAKRSSSPVPQPGTVP